MAERRWTPADRELAAAILYAVIDGDTDCDWAKLSERYKALAAQWRERTAAVLDALTAAGWRPGASEVLDRHLELHANRIRWETAEAIAQAIEAHSSSIASMWTRRDFALIARAHGTASEPVEELSCRVPGEHGEPICIRWPGQQTCATCPAASRG